MTLVKEAYVLCIILLDIILLRLRILQKFVATIFGQLFSGIWACIFHSCGKETCFCEIWSLWIKLEQFINSRSIYHLQIHWFYYWDLFQLLCLLQLMKVVFSLSNNRQNYCMWNIKTIYYQKSYSYPCIFNQE